MEGRSISVHTERLKFLGIFNMAPRTYLLEWKPREADDWKPWLLQIFDDGEFIEEKRFETGDKDRAEGFASAWVCCGDPSYL